MLRSHLPVIVAIEEGLFEAAGLPTDRDEVSAAIWRKLGISNERIFFLPKKDNWWGPAGATGHGHQDLGVAGLRVH